MSKVVTTLLVIKKTLMISGGRGQQPFGAPDATARMRRACRPGPPLMSGITADTCLEAGEAERQLWERPAARCQRSPSGLPCCWVSAVVQFDHSAGSAITCAIQRRR